jgi:hypothetical protein
MGLRNASGYRRTLVGKASTVNIVRMTISSSNTEILVMKNKKDSTKSPVSVMRQAKAPRYLKP